MEQLRKKKCSGSKLKQSFDLEKRKQLGKDKKRDRKIKKLLKLEKEIDETIESIRNLIRLKKENETKIDETIESTRNLIRLKKENETTKDRIIRDIRYIY